MINYDVTSMSINPQKEIKITDAFDSSQRLIWFNTFFVALQRKKTKDKFVLVCCFAFLLCKAKNKKA